jgi:hypothetical protein
MDSDAGRGNTHGALHSFPVIAGLDPAIPIMWHGRALLSGMAGSSPAMTYQWVRYTPLASVTRRRSSLISDSWYR